jgi:peptidoglycan/xylan/chitin deacetylase (PgdA/CDA1 family)
MFKRSLVLAFALALFIAGFFVHQYWFDATQVAGKFRAEREKFHVEGQDLTTVNPPGPEPLTPTPSPIPVTPTADAGGYSATGGSSVPGGPAAAPVPDGAMPATSLDSNALITPATPPAAPSDTPMNPEVPGTAPATPAPSTNATPDSTMIYPGLHRLPMVLFGSFTTQGLHVQATDAAPAAAAKPAPPVQAATDTNVSVTPAAVPSPTPSGTATNAPPAAEAISEAKGPKTAVSAIVLLYHQFTPPGVRAPAKFMWTMPQDVFATEMKYLHDNHFNVVPLADVIAFAKGEKELPPNAVAITFDDGYKSPLVFAAPILKQYNFPWTFFVYPAFIGNHPTTNYRGAASWPELVELQKEGVDIECHSMTHPNLKSNLQVWPPDSKHAHRLTPEEYDTFLTDEIVTSKQIIEKQLNKTVTRFAYPYGNYNKQVEAKAVAAGYQAIFTVNSNPIHVGSPLYSMGRYTMTTPVEKMFTAYVNQRSLILTDIQPEPGSTTTDPRPVITATLRYAGDIKIDSISAEVSNMGYVKSDFDPKSSVLRLYLPRDLVAQTIVIDVHAKDADSGHTLAANWRFDYHPTAAGVLHQPIGAAGATNANATVGTTPAAAATNAAASSATPASGGTTPAAAATNAAASPAEPAPGTAAPAMTNVPAVSTTNAAP